jgi:GNAT superfamily N-acetyltransferase
MEFSTDILNMITIREMELQDIPQIAQLLGEIGYFDHINHENLDDTIKNIKTQWNLVEKDALHHILIAVTKIGEIIGYCGMQIISYFFLAGPECYISELFIKETWRGHGVGRQLMNHAQEFAKKNQCSRLSLLNNRDRDSYKRQFYVKMGFKERVNMANFIQSLN